MTKINTGMNVYVAVVETRYEVMAVARTADDAIRIASERALQFLRDNDAVIDGVTDTVEGVAEYFGVYANEIEIGAAILVGI